MNVADRIFELRKRKGLSQEELANEIGVSRQAISKWESEQSTPDIDKIRELCKIFNVSADYLLNGEEPQKKAYDFKRILFSLGSLFDWIGLSILIFDMYLTWGREPNFMGTKEIAVKVIAVIIVLFGTTLFILSEKNLTYKNVRKFLLINVPAYTGVIAMISYLVGVPGRLWIMIVYFGIVFISEIILLKIR